MSEESKAQLAESAAPPIRLVTLKSDGYEIKAGNEVVLFRHEKTFYNKPGLFVKVDDRQSLEEIKAAISNADAYQVNYVGIGLGVDGFAVEAASGDANKFGAAVQAVRSASKRPLILVGESPSVLEAGLKVLTGETAMIYAANANNWEAMSQLAKQYQAALAVSAPDVDSMAAFTQKVK